MSHDDNYSDNTADDISQTPSPFSHPSPELPGYIFDHTNSSQSIEDFSNFAATQVLPCSSPGFGNPFNHPTIPCASEPQVEPDYFEPLEDPTSGYEVYASSMLKDPSASTQTLTSYQLHFLYGPQPTAPLPVTNIRSNSFGSVSGDVFKMSDTGVYNLPGGGWHYQPSTDIGSNTMGQGYASSDFFIVSPPATPSTEQSFPSDGHFAGDQLGCPHGSPCEECTEDQCAFLWFRNPPDQYGNEVYFDELSTARTFKYESLVNSPHFDEVPSISISPSPAAIFMDMPRGEHQANINSANLSLLQAAQSLRGGEAQRLDSVHASLVNGTSSALMDPLCKCCRFKRKSELPEGPLPGEQETEAWLRAEEFDGLLAHNIPLTLAEMVSRLAPGKGLFARKWCILAIWGSESRALTTEGILEALNKAVKKFGDDAGAAIPQGPNKKRTRWAAIMISALSTNTIFVQKSQDGERSCKWRVDVRGEKFHSKRTKCRHGGHQASNSPRNNSG